MKPLRCVIKKNAILIEVGFDVVKFATEHHPELYDDERDGGNYAVTDIKEFAKEVVSAINKEEEDGSSPLTNLFDAAIMDAICQGAEGVEERNAL